MTKPEVIELVTVLMACFPAARFPDSTAAAYEQFLGDLEHERALQAVEILVKSSEFMPTIAKVVATYESLAPRKPESGYRLFRPAPIDQPMAPGELKSAIEAALEAMK
jgi:hypothetical protein